MPRLETVPPGRMEWPKESLDDSKRLSASSALNSIRLRFVILNIEEIRIIARKIRNVRDVVFFLKLSYICDIVYIIYKLDYN